VAVKRRPRLEMVHFLVNRYPRALHERAADGSPLHMTAQSDAHVEVIDLFLRMRPKALACDRPGRRRRRVPMTGPAPRFVAHLLQYTISNPS
jgi:hypothetical protein